MGKGVRGGIKDKDVGGGGEGGKGKVSLFCAKKS